MAKIVLDIDQCREDLISSMWSMRASELVIMIGSDNISDDKQLKEDLRSWVGELSAAEVLGLLDLN